MKANANQYFRIVGKKKISGEIEISGNKNEALPLIAIALLAEDIVTLENVPDIHDIHTMCSILQELGVECAKEQESLSMTIRIDPRQITNQKLPIDLCGKLRGSICLAAPMLVRFKKVLLPFPGGDRIGRRRLDSHILALSALGVSVTLIKEGIELSCTELVGADILLDECSVTATENTVALACFAQGKTVIQNAACEPHVQKLCMMLNAMGANITGIGSNVLYIEGIKNLRGVKFKISPDYLEIGSFISLAALCGGELTIRQVCQKDLRPICNGFHRLGIAVENNDNTILVREPQSLEIQNDFGDVVPRIDSSPWPGFPADMTSVAVVTATQCQGSILIHEKMFESRLFFLDTLIGMGARIILCDPHRAVILGSSCLRGTLLTSPDIRAGMALLIAALCAHGESIIHNIGQIDRGFSKIENRLQKLGADIERVTPNYPQ